MNPISDSSSNEPVLPPPLPIAEPAWRAYVRSWISLLPAFTAWGFASLFLQPKLETIWREAGLEGSRAQWLVSFSDGFRQNFWFAFVGLVVLLGLLEFRVRAWSRLRRPLLFASTVLLNAAVFIWILGLATAALLAVPIALRAE